jgi:hypothetical protein
MNWHIPAADHSLVVRAAQRAVKLAARHGRIIELAEMMMDLTACHANDTPLNLDLLLSFPDGDFGHDVFGIRRHINRQTGRLGDCFLPRCARIGVLL